jgi:hypothetical protein
MTPTNLPALREAVAKIEPCPKCGGDGFLVTNSSHAEHDPRCDGTCRFCPIEVPDQDIGPCDCALAQASITEDDHWRLVCTLRALLDELEAARHSDALIEAKSRRGITDCSTPLFIRVQNIVEQLEKAEAALAAARAELKSYYKMATEGVWVPSDEYAAEHAALRAARAVLDTARWPSSEANGRLLLNVDAAAWHAWWQARKGLTP